MPSTISTGCEAPGSHFTAVPSTCFHAASPCGMPPATVNFGCAPARLSVTVRISRAASTDSLASVVPGTAQRAAS